MTGVRPGSRLPRAGARACALALLVPALATAQMLASPRVTEHPAAAAERELAFLDSVGDGIALTLAVCEEEPHCIEGISRHEVARRFDELHQRVEHLQGQRGADGGGLSEAHAALLPRYRAMRARYAGYLREILAVTERIDPNDLEQDWVELLDFGVPAPAEPAGRDVPSPNDRLRLEQFQDDDEPIPLD
jgi:hypothetical protein